MDGFFPIFIILFGIVFVVALCTSIIRCCIVAGALGNEMNRQPMMMAPRKNNS